MPGHDEMNRRTSGPRPPSRLVILMLLAGAMAWWLWLPVVRFTLPRFSGTTWSFMWRDVAIQAAIVASAFALGCVPGIGRFVSLPIERARNPSTAARRWTALALALISGTYLYATAVRQGRVLLP